MTYICSKIKNMKLENLNLNKVLPELDKPLVFFDVETTGLDLMEDEIIQIYLVKIMPNGDTLEMEQFFNPNKKISEDASRVHGIVKKMLADKPKFCDKSKDIFEFIGDSYILGYNSNRFDVPILARQLKKCGIDFDTSKYTFIDVFNLEKILTGLRLVDTYERYSGETLDNAHDAGADVKATAFVFLKQLEKHKGNKLPDNLKEIAEVSFGKDRNGNRVLDLGGKFIEKDGQVCWNFGKNKGKPVWIDGDYAKWVIKEAFLTEDGKKILEKAIENNNKKLKNESKKVRKR